MRIVPFDEWTLRGRWGPTRRRQNPSAALVVHHTVTPVTSNAIADAQAVEDVIWSRRFSAGFTSVPYSWLLHPDGTMLASRGTVYRNGANKAARPGVTITNSNSMSVALIGNYETRSVTPQQRRSFDLLRAELADLGHLTNAANVVGHNAVAFTACPGHAVVQLLHPKPDDTETEEQMETLVSKTTGEAWVTAGNRARPIRDVDQWLATFDGPVISAANMEHVVADLYELVQ